MTIVYQTLKQFFFVRAKADSLRSYIILNQAYVMNLFFPTLNNVRSNIGNTL